MSRLLGARSVLRICLAFCWAASARGVAASDLAIQWSAPADCPDRAEIVSRVESELGDAAQAKVTAKAVVTRTADLYRAELRIQTPTGYGERTLENTRCEILAESVALVIALSASRPGPARGERLRLALSAHATGVAGPLPRVAVGVGGALALEGVAALRLELSGSYYASQSATFAQTNVGANFQMLRFGARACRVWTLGVLELAPCLGAQWYRVRGSGFGGMAFLSGAALLWGPALGAFLRLRLLPPLAIHLAADGFLLLSQQRFVYSDRGELHRPSALGFQLFLAPELLF
jgi:hypothetical protein